MHTVISLCDYTTHAYEIPTNTGGRYESKSVTQHVQEIESSIALECNAKTLNGNDSPANMPIRHLPYITGAILSVWHGCLLFATNKT